MIHIHQCFIVEHTYIHIHTSIHYIHSYITTDPASINTAGHGVDPTTVLLVPGLLVDFCHRKVAKLIRYNDNIVCIHIYIYNIDIHIFFLYVYIHIYFIRVTFFVTLICLNSEWGYPQLV